MVQFCTNCGTKLEEDALFCINCGTKVDESDNKSKKSFVKTIQDDREIKRAKKELKKLCGGFRSNKTYKAKLSQLGIIDHYYVRENRLKDYAGRSIKKQLETEIKSGQVKSGYVELRLNELMLEYKSQVEKEKRIINELLQSDEIQSKIKEYDISESKVVTIKEHLQLTKINAKDENAIKKEIKSNIIVELEKERDKKILEENKKKEKEFYENRVKYVEDKIKKSHPDIKLAPFEKRRIANVKQSPSIELELNKIANLIISNHRKIEEYDFAGELIEEGGFTNAVDIVSLEKHARKDSDYISYVFLKIFENNIKIFGSNIKPIYISFKITPKYKSIVGRDRTIFFSDITGISYSNDEIHLNLVNKEKLILKEAGNYNIEETIGAFFKSLNHAWENFKNNENEQNGSMNKKEEVNTADELMKYAELYEKGLLTEEEFNAAKKKLLGL